MKKLNNVQLEQVEDLSEDTSKEFANTILKYTAIVTSEELDNLYNEAVEDEEAGEYVMYNFDMNYYSVASNYCELDEGSILVAFGFYGELALYMDDLGRGLMVGFY